MEDPSSIWYDNLEQMKKDYQDMKEVYDIVCTFKPVEVFEAVDSDSLTMATEEQKLAQMQRKLSTMRVAPAPQHNNQLKQRQYDHFIKLRRNADQWGRMMLMKPNRKYKQRKFLISHKYFVHDTMKNLFAIALMDDSDFSDY